MFNGVSYAMWNIVPRKHVQICGEISVLYLRQRIQEWTK